MESLDRLLELPVRPPTDPCSTEVALRYGRECASAALWNERAAVLGELDKLAREFDAAGRAKTAKRIREVAAVIDARLNEPKPGGFAGGARGNEKSA